MKGNRMTQTNASTMNPEIKAAVEAFAKSRNVPVSACLQAAAMALAMQPFEDVVIDVSTPITKTDGDKLPSVRKPQGKRIPRQAGEKSVQFRDAVVAKAAELKGKRHTFAEIGSMFGIDPANAVNNLKWLQSHKKINYQVVGHATKQAGQKGRAPAIIEFV
jgi:hypothetical protein